MTHSYEMTQICTQGTYVLLSERCGYLIKHRIDLLFPFQEITFNTVCVSEFT
jgi:hypothetical protein